MAFRETVRRLRRDQIVQATLQVLGRLGCDALQMKDVAAAAAMSRTTVYAEYRSREQLIDAALASAADTFLPRVEAELRAKPGNAGIVAVAELLAEAALGSPAEAAQLPCCLRRVRCPWPYWGRVAFALTRALEEAQASAGVVDPPVGPQLAPIVLRALLVCAVAEGGERLHAEQLLSVFRAVIETRTG